MAKSTKVSDNDPVSESLAILAMPMEPDQVEWKEYGRYMVSSYGQVRSTIYNRNVGRVNTKGYMTFLNSDKGLDEKFHRVVALLFIPNPLNLPQVNHIDGDKKNNSVPNLEWCDQSTNIQHAYDTGLMPKKGYDKPLYNSMSVEAFLGEKSIGVFISTRECARLLNLSQGNIWSVLKGESRHTKGYTFKQLQNK